MKRLHRSCLGPNGLILLGAGLLSMQAVAQEGVMLNDDTDRLSYALGMDLGQQMHRLAVEVKPELFAKGLQDGLSGGKTLMSHEEVQAVIAALQQELQRREQAKAMLQATQFGQASRPATPAHN